MCFSKRKESQVRVTDSKKRGGKQTSQHNMCGLNDNRREKNDSIVSDLFSLQRLAMGIESFVVPDSKKRCQ
jgi:hypothetical protein